MLIRLSEAEPVLVSVTVCAALVVITFCEENVKLVGEIFAAGPPVLPVPVRATDCGLPVALSATEIDAVRVPTAVGANRTLIVQFPPAVTARSQVLDSEKSPAFAPVIVMLEIDNVALPVLNKVTPLGELVTPTAVLANTIVPVLKLTAGAVPIPVREAVCGLPVALSAIETLA